MASSIRQKIVEDVETSLDAIAIAGGFQTDVTTVERLIRHWDDNKSDRPWIGFTPSRETYQYQPNNCIRVTLPFQLLAYVDKVDQAVRADTTQKVNDLLDDIIKALMADPTRSGNAVMTTITNDDTDESIDCPVGIVQLNFTVVYFRTTAGSIT